MRKFLLLCFFLAGCISWSQDYSFLSASSKKMRHDDYSSLIESPEYRKDSLNHPKPNYFLDTGETFNKAYTDSIAKSKEGYKYRTYIYRDTLSGRFSYILHKQTDEELRVEGEYWKKSIKEDNKNRKKLMGSVVNDLTLTDMDGVSHTMESLAGKIVVIDFWFIHCGSCVMEMPELNELKEKYGTDNIAWFGVTFDPKDKVALFLQKTRFDYTIIPDDKPLTERFGITFYPTTLILDTNRKIVYTGTNGPMTGRTKEIKKVLKKLLKHRKSNVVAGPVNN